MKTNKKRVGASVIPPAYIGENVVGNNVLDCLFDQEGYNPYYNNGYYPYPPPIVNPIIPPIVGPPGRPLDIGGSFVITPGQVIAAGSTVPITFSSILYATGGVAFAGSSISVPTAGKYLITFNANVTGAGLLNSITFSLSGSVAGSGSFVANTAGTIVGSTSGSVIAQLPANSSIMVMASVPSTSGAVTINSGNLSLQLLA